MPDGPSGLDNPVASVDQEGNVSGGEMFTGGHGDWRMGPLPIQLSKAASLSLSPTVSLQQELSPSHPPWFLPLLASALENVCLAVSKPTQCFPLHMFTCTIPHPRVGSVLSCANSTLLSRSQILPPPQRLS